MTNGGAVCGSISLLMAIPEDFMVEVSWAQWIHGGSAGRELEEAFQGGETVFSKAQRYERGRLLGKRRKAGLAGAKSGERGGGGLWGNM